MPDIHVPMRWSDLDVLNHVNNVVYVDYAMEALGRLVDDGIVGEDLPVRRVGVDFLRPLLLSSAPVLVRSTVEADVVTCEIRSNDGSALFCSVTVEHGRPEPADDDHGIPFQMQVRRGDLGSDGRVSLPHLFELFQESRILAFGQIFPYRAAGRFVVGRVEVDLGERLSWRRDPYVVRSHINHVGRSTFSSMTRIEGGRFGSATATLVGFDLETQTSRPLDDDERDALVAAMPPDLG